MAELATIARPYAEALFKAAGAQASGLVGQMEALAVLAGDQQLCQLADNPRVTPGQVFDLVAGVAMKQGLNFDAKAVNLLQTVLDNGRLNALPEITAQFKRLVNAESGASEAEIQSAYVIDLPMLDGVVAALERRFGRKLNVHVSIVPELIGGIRVVVGDEVLDTSVKARLEQMKVALTA